MPALVISVGPAKGKGKLSDAIVEQMRKKKGMAKEAPSEPEAEEAEESTEGADEAATLREMFDELEAGNDEAALKAFKALIASCG